MDYTSLRFLAVFPSFFLLYWALPGQTRRWSLLGASLWFAWLFGPRAFQVLLAVTLITWLAGLGMKGSPRLKRLWLVLGVGASGGALFALKAAQIALPGAGLLTTAGMAYYTLQGTAYLVDVFTGKCRAQTSLPEYALYMSYFPRFLCGPIQRAEDFFPQLRELEQKRFDPDSAAWGATLMLVGYARKIVLALPLAAAADMVFGAPEQYRGASVFIGFMAFGMSLYFDFSGYSSLARGAARLLALEVPENFRRPYLAVSPSDFWRRWHISLSTWLRDYLYIPLGGNRRGTLRKRVNLVLTYTASGLWHGSGWNYLLWGAMNGLFQVAEDILRPVTRRIPENPITVGLRRVMMVVLFNYSFLFFRADSVSDGLRLTRQMLFPSSVTGEASQGLGLGLPVWLVLLAALALELLLEQAAESAEAEGTDLYARFRALPGALRWLLLGAMGAVTLLFACRMVGGNASGFYYAMY